MAPKLSRIERKELENTIISKYQGKHKMTDKEIAKVFPQCTTRTVRNARSNIMRYGTIDRPPKPFGRPPEVTENMWMAIWYELRRRPSLSQRAQANFLYKLYGIRVSRSTIGRGVKWTKKKMITIAKERNRDLRDDFIHRRSLFKLRQLVCVDESGDDREVAIPKKGYAPKGVPPIQRKPFHRGQRVSFLPAYTIDGVIYSEVYEGTTDLEVFESFLVNLLPHCGRYPEPRSVVIMDNAAFHNISQTVKDLFAEAGVLIVKQSPYSPDLNAIEYFFGSLKNHIESRALEDEDHIRGDLKNYLRIEINTMGRGETGRKWARGHFRKAQFYNEEDLE
ncbi:TPR domain protein [Metarhizium robertsii ARSEF 23]|uniref:TPR domain protein n=1 Tax=Metarhizium robertsii (strain ARSEF 23 / ATCC MYA-3075) TaxID=655844 RepID=E9EK12_METRA|nr:TPR domain protein [Metarhizium robertsii ARSEF 23]EFZ03023.2 TPR domain protein [Metarhizium robertsii ARSEF 23]